MPKKPARRAKAAKPPQRRVARQRRRRSRPRRGSTLLPIAGGILFFSIATAYFTPLREAAQTARDAVVEATLAGRHAATREAVVLRYAMRYRISFELAAAIERAALAEGIDPDLGFRLIQVESRFRERAVSSAGALGLTQLMPATADELQPGITHEEIFDRDTNLRLGFRYLNWLLRLYKGDVTEALHAYNRGPGTVARIRAAGGDPANGYADRVLKPEPFDPPPFPFGANASRMLPTGR